MRYCRHKSVWTAFGFNGRGSADVFTVSCEQNGKPRTIAVFKRVQSNAQPLRVHCVRHAQFETPVLAKTPASDGLCFVNRALLEARARNLYDPRKLGRLTGHTILPRTSFVEHGHRPFPLLVQPGALCSLSPVLSRWPFRCLPDYRSSVFEVNCAPTARFRRFNRAPSGSSNQVRETYQAFFDKHEAPLASG